MALPLNQYSKVSPASDDRDQGPYQYNYHIQLDMHLH